MSVTKWGVIQTPNQRNWGISRPKKIGPKAQVAFGFLDVLPGSGKPVSATSLFTSKRTTPRPKRSFGSPVAPENNPGVHCALLHRFDSTGFPWDSTHKRWPAPEPPHPIFAPPFKLRRWVPSQLRSAQNLLTSGLYQGFAWFQLLPNPFWACARLPGDRVLVHIGLQGR